MDATIKVGVLQVKQPGKSFLLSPSWRTKECSLSRTGVLEYREGTKKGTIHITQNNLVSEVPAKESKKSGHVFAITSTDKSCFDGGRFLFSSHTAEDMNDWIKLIKKIIQEKTTSGITAAKAPVRKADKKKQPVEDHDYNKENQAAVPDPTDTSEAANSIEGVGCVSPAAAKKSIEADDTGWCYNSLGKNKSEQFKYAPGDLEGMMFGSLGRNKLKTKEMNVDRRKRKAGEEDEDDGCKTPEQTDDQKGAQLESVTKNRVKGPAGRRMPQHRRTQHQLLMKHRASSLSALAQHNGSGGSSSIGKSGEVEPNEGDTEETMSFIPWLNRSLDLIDDPSVTQSRHSQPTLGFLYSDPEDEPDEVYELKPVGATDQNNQFRFNNDGSSNANPFYLQNAANSVSSNTMNISASSNPGVGIVIAASAQSPPPLPPRMESRMDFVGGQSQGIPFHQIQQSFQQVQYHAPVNNIQNTQAMSPFGSALQNPQNRRSVVMDDIGNTGDVFVTRTQNNELFIASFSDNDNSGDIPQKSMLVTNSGVLGSSGNYQLDSTNSSGSSPAQKLKSQSQQQSQQRSKQQNLKSNSNTNQQNLKSIRNRSIQPADANRFNTAVRNLQKHVVELDQAVNGITKEVEDSKSDLANIKTALVTLKKDKDRLADSISIVTQEASKMKELVTATVKEADKLQKTATAALVVAEKAKVDQLNLKREYESMIQDLKNTIDRIKVEAAESFGALGSRTPNFENRRTRKVSRYDIDDDSCDDDGVEDEEPIEIHEEKTSTKKKKQLRDSSQGRSGKSNEKSFFSRPSSIISGFTNRASLVKASSATEVSEKENRQGKMSLSSSSKSEKSKNSEKTEKSKVFQKKSSKKAGIKLTRHFSDDIPMMDETTSSPRTMTPICSDNELTESDFAQNGNFNLGKSISSPTVSSRPRVLNLTSQKQVVSGSNMQSSPDSPTRPSSPFDVVPKLHVNGRATSPTAFTLHRPGSTPGPLNRQGSMTTVPEDRAIDVRQSDNRPTEPPPPPPTNSGLSKSGIFAISRQNSSPDISTQKSGPQIGNLQRQHSLGVVLEESGRSTMSRQASLLSVPDDRLIVDRTLPMSPTSSLMSFPGSWSTTSLNRPDGAADDGYPQSGEGVQRPISPRSGVSSPVAGSSVHPVSVILKSRSKGPLEQVAGVILAGSTTQVGTVCSFDEKDDDPPIATSSLKKRKKIKKDPVQV